MYIDFYRLKQVPFHITPDPHFLFLSPSHKAALGAMIYGIDERQGFMAITGEVGLGKTTIMRSYLERVDPKQLRTICIFNANISFKDLLKAIYQAFDLDCDTDDLVVMINQLHKVFINEYQQGRNIALLVDEAQNMPIETLENLRMLSNLETSTQKLVQIVLVGQPEFEHKLNLHELRQLKQRIVIHATVAPLTEKESLAYVQHRLAKVALTDEPIFAKKALKMLVKAAKGTPRVLNTLCTNVLIAGFGYQQNPVSVKIVREVIAALQEKNNVSFRKSRLVYVAAAILLVSAFWLSPYKDFVLAKVKDFGPPPSLRPSTGMFNQDMTPDKPSVDIQTKNEQSSSKPEPQSFAIIEDSIEPEEMDVVGREKTNIIDKTSPNDISNNFVIDSDVVRDNGSQDKSESILNVLKNDKDIVDVNNPGENSETDAPPFPRVVSVRKGDYLSKMALELYGFASPELLERIEQHNPHIKDVNRVDVGEEIVFPALPATIDGR